MRASTRWGTAVFVVGLVLAAGCGEPSPEEQVRGAIRDAAVAAGERDMQRLEGFVSDDYADERGRDARALRGLAALYLRAQDAVHLFTRVGELRLDGPRRADVVVWVASASRPIEGPEQLRSLNADLLRVELRLVRERDGAWRAVRAAWREVTPGDFLPFS